MKIAIFHLYPFRPHIYYTRFLKTVLEKKHKVVYVSCFNNFQKCYYKEINEYNKLSCLKCNMPYLFTKTYRLKPTRKTGVLLDENIINSTIACSKRFETLNQINDYKNEFQSEVKLFNQELENSYQMFKSFLIQEKIDFVWGFNGRMDHTKTFFRSCKDMQIPFISFEYPWFGNGIQLIENDDCLSLKVWNYVNNKYKNIPLNFKQSLKAYKYADKRYNKNMAKEWRDYSNLEKKKPVNKFRILILPSSRNEVEGHVDYVSKWGHSTTGFEMVINQLKVQPKDVYVQLHPIWFQKVYGKSGSKIIDVYIKWANKNKYNIISNEKAYESKILIENSEIVLVNGSSAVFECGFLGKPVINVELNKFTDSGITCDVTEEKDLFKIQSYLNADVTERKLYTFRFIYSVIGRLTHMENAITAVDSTKILFDLDNAFDTLMSCMNKAQNGIPLIADEYEYNGNKRYEEDFIQLITSDGRAQNSGNRTFYNSIDKIRRLNRKGDEV